MGTDNTLDAAGLAEQILKRLKQFERVSDEHLRAESYVAVDACRYAIAIKLRSPFGDADTLERVGSTNELQQRVNHWLGVQRGLGSLAAIRLTLTPEIDGANEMD